MLRLDRGCNFSCFLSPHGPAQSAVTPHSFDGAVMVVQVQWYDLRLETRKTRVTVRTLPWASSHLARTTGTRARWNVRSQSEPRCRVTESPQRLHSPMLTFATKKQSTGANEQKEDAASLFRAVFLIADMLWLTVTVAALAFWMTRTRKVDGLARVPQIYF